jgi:hypothetical protein
MNQIPYIKNIIHLAYCLIHLVKDIIYLGYGFDESNPYIKITIYIV